MAVVSDELKKPNGVCFAPDCKKFYAVDTGRPGSITLWDVVNGNKLENKRLFALMSLKTKDP
jgi:gluconolactonase